MIVVKRSFPADDRSRSDFQYLEDLSTAYWCSEILFAALELRLFELLDKELSALGVLAREACCREKELHRLLIALERLGLVRRVGKDWFNSLVSEMYMVPGRESYLGDFLLYRRYLRPGWGELAKRISGGKEKRDAASLSLSDNYEVRTFNYVRALDGLARRKAEEIIELLDSESWDVPVFDIGGGAGALGRALIQTKKEGCAVLFELPEVAAAARSLYPNENMWERMSIIEGDFRSYEFKRKDRFGLIIMGNFLHTYGGKTARELLCKALDLLEPEGLFLMHDYFPDRIGRSPLKGPLYDINMMLNTFDGVCHRSLKIARWLRDAGMCEVRVRDLATDSSVISARRR